MFFYSIQCSGKKTFFIKVNCCYEFFLGATLFLSSIQVFGEKSVFYINFRNDSTTLAAKLRKNWLRIIHVKFPELTLFFDCVCDCSEFVFINFFQKKKKKIKTLLEACFLLICFKKYFYTMIFIFLQINNFYLNNF